MAVRFGQVDIGVMILSYQSLALWVLGYPEAGLSDSNLAVKHGRETGQAAALMLRPGSRTVDLHSLRTLRSSKYACG